MTKEKLLEQNLAHCEGCENFYQDNCKDTCAYEIYRTAMEKQIPEEAIIYNFPKATVGFCPECGNLLGKHSKYCDICGQAVINS